MLWSLSQIQWAAESTGDGSGDSQLCGESTGHSAADKSCVCLAGLISSLFIWPWPFFYTSSDLRLNTADYVWSRRYFRSTSSHRWSIKLIFSALNSPLITLPLAPPFSLMQRSSSPPPLPPALLINIFDTNACCSNNTEWWVLEMKLELRILITQGQTMAL